MNKYKIIAVMGKAGSGKDSFVKALISGGYINNLKPIVSCTTRPIREHEQDGVDYYFLTREQFTEKVLSGDMLEATIFNDWCYGTAKSTLDINAINIGVFNPEGVEILKHEYKDNIDLLVVYIIANDKVRLLRQLNREDNPDCDEIIRRFGTDKKDFSLDRINEIAPDFVKENNGDFSIEDLAQWFSLDYAFYCVGQNMKIT